MNLDYDVAVIGAGAAGLAAAISAAEAGASVIVLDAGKRVGGSSRLSGGHVFAAGTPLQREAGVDDDPDAMFDHIMTLNQWMLEPSVVRRYCDEAGDTLEWLRRLGVEFKAERVYRSGIGPIPRGHAPEGEGLAVIEALDRERARRGIELGLTMRVDALQRSESGAVIGLSVGEESLRSAAVIVATGGFGASRAMIERHFPDADAAGDWAWYLGCDEAQGDGLGLGQSVGAALDGHNRGLLLVTPGFSHDLEVFLPGWLMVVDRAGRRFMDETAPYTVMAGLLKRHGGSSFAIFDEAARAAAAPNPISRAYWVDEILEGKADEGRIVRSDTLGELAAAAGIDAAALEGTVRRYNADCEKGRDSAFFKHPASGMRAIVSPPFYAVEIRPAIIAWTGAGLRIDADSQVIDLGEKVIPGLYAAGETVGSLHGDRYIGGGGSFGPCLAFGRIAGRNAADYARSR